MTEPRPSSRLSRRALVGRGVSTGVALPAITALVRVARTEAGSLPVAISEIRGDQLDRTDPLTVIVTENNFDFDPHSSGSEASLFFFGVYELLLQLKDDRTDEFAPMLADAWEANADQTSYTFHLSPAAVFHDGSPCDAAAVKASFARFLGLAGPPVSIVSRFVQDPDQIVVVDEHTIRFDLGRPQPLFLSSLASAYGAFVVNPGVVDAHKTADDPWAHQWLMQNTAGAGTGPYRITENAPGERTVLTRFDDYHRGWDGDHVDAIVVRVVEDDLSRRLLLERSEADAVTEALTTEDIAALASVPSLQIVSYDTTNVAWIAMNAHGLRTADVRKGFSYAFPYDEVVNGVFHGRLGRGGPLATSIRGCDPNIFLYPTDLAQAKALILAGGFVEGDSFELMFPAEWLEALAVAQLFQANVQAMGFALELVPIDHTTQIDIIYGDLPAEERPDFFTSGWWPDYDDPWVQLAPNFLRAGAEGSDGVANVGLWSNDRFEQIMAEAKTYSEEARLVELMREAQNILTEQDPPVIYLGQLRYTTVLSSGVRGFVGNPLYLNQYPFYQMFRATD